MRRTGNISGNMSKDVLPTALECPRNRFYSPTVAERPTSANRTKASSGVDLISDALLFGRLWSNTRLRLRQFLCSVALIPAPETRGRKFQRVGVGVCNGRSNLRCAAVRSAVVPHPTQARQFLCSVALIPAPETRGRKFQRVGVRVCNGSHHPKC
jgi:hypothetical protein